MDDGDEQGDDDIEGNYFDDDFDAGGDDDDESGQDGLMNQHIGGQGLK